MKQLFYNLTLSKKLLIAPAIVIIFLLILGGVSYVSLGNQKSAINDIFNNRFAIFQSSTDLDADIVNVQANLYKIITWANAKYDEKKIEALGKEQEAVLNKSEETIKSTLQVQALDQEEKKVFQTVVGNFAEYKKAALSEIDLASSDLNMATMYMGTADNKYETLHKSMQVLIGLEKKLSKDRYDYSIKNFNATIIIFVIVMAASIVLSLLVSLFIREAIIRPVLEAIGVTTKIAEGDLLQQVDVASHDEIGRLMEAIKNMGEKLKEVLTETRTAADNLASSSQELSANSEQMSRGVAEQSNRSSQIATSAQEMSQTVMDIAKNASDMATSAAETTVIAHEGENIVDRSIQEVKAIADTVNESAKLMSSLGERSKQIGDIVDVIKDIADQTNLLALNAAIEAARAGDQGRGFAVVADEVRKLAERTSKATTEIGSMITAIQHEVEKAVLNMSDGTKRVVVGVDFATKAGDALHSIVSSVQGLQTMVQQIASATEEMSKTSEDMSGDIETIASVTKETLSTSGQIARSASGLAELSSMLQRLVGRFKV
jgi:methyl-accepting chemotaxis protein